MTDSFDLFTKLYEYDLLKNSPTYWWPNAGTLEVVVGAVLTQNSNWTRVEHSLENLTKQGLVTLNDWLDVDETLLQEAIRPSGMHRRKAHYLLLLMQHIVEEFKSFEKFQIRVDRSWLLSQKGIGKESADAILNYACKRDVMVVDNYTLKLLPFLNSYDKAQAWLDVGLRSAQQSLIAINPLYKDLWIAYAHFHGMIVEYSKHRKKEGFGPL